MTVQRTRVCVYVCGEPVDIELSAQARGHLLEQARARSLPGISALVQALAVAAAYPHSPRIAADLARMPYARWLAVIALASTGYSSLSHQLARSTKAFMA